MSSGEPPTEPRTAPARLRAALLAAWLVFWVLMIVTGFREDRGRGDSDLWHVALAEGSSMLVASLVALVQWRRIRRLDALLSQPLRWFARVLLELPLLAPAYVAVVYGIRHGLHLLLGMGCHPRPWPELLLGESLRFALYYVLFAGVFFGLRSHLAWTEERLRAERLLRLSQEARLLQLTQQLQPHFLFNALNTISSLIHTEPELADRLLTRLAALLRAATDASQSPRQSLGEELQLLRSYSELMAERYGPRVSVRWEVDESILAHELPTLSLQPLLENCFKHVVERRLRPTQIVVRAAKREGLLRIEVEDDGEPLVAPPSLGVGLGNLKSRLQAVHGESARLSLDARVGGGLVARVELPCAS